MSEATNLLRRPAASPSNYSPAEGHAETDALLSADIDATVDSEQAPTSASIGGRKDSWDGGEDFAGLPWTQRPSIYWLIGPYALFTLAFGGSLVPKLNLIIDLVCRQYFADRQHEGFHVLPVVPGANNPQCQIAEVQRNVATFTLVLSVIVGSLSAFTAPRLGAASDRYGRKAIMVISSSGGLVGEVITILAANYPDIIHYNWLILASVIDGFAGSFTAGSVVSHSYTSDCTPPSKRAVSFGYMHACLFSGLAFGPLLAGFLVEWTGSLLSIFYVTLCCHAVFILYIIFILPESLSPRRQSIAREKYAKEQELHAIQNREFDLAHEAAAASGRKTWLPAYARKTILRVRRSNPLAPLAILFPNGAHQRRARRNLLVLATIDTLLLAAAMSLGGVTLLYTEFMFHWGNFETSAFISLVSMVRVVVLMGIFPVINYFFRVRPAARQRRISGEAPSEANRGADRLDIFLIRSAIFSDVLGVAGYIFARKPAVFVLCGIVTAFGGLGSATIQSSLTKHVSPDRVGQLLGAIGLLHALSRVFAPMIFNGLYAATVGSYPQAVFVLVTGVFSFVFLLAFLVRPHVFLDDSIHNEEEAPVSSRRAVAAQNDVLGDDEVVQQF
ncbi:major facilitator superfamily MFS-1 [Sporothrix brasiliensis 5110]|uniref:Major facilitator superfamily MFS-1 n=1 Tax=Sporothrix brasiliensis 5110 TaxID=1398154 RepID=A0A0C2IME5_9PEZI|nr:major facilitator superfamily MFS-1 [Sporothrix brasiliensis 5110]KIH90206.1 major facilitator superfamily MFS-1 [Sporothrix brasiliensis 5110]